ncbi:lymphatic vessel endothelial hyaluronic receptor 1b [Cololabis saira]|uniref:lymphatic vessel endothelial hyaluronic receptor 1b n=1 Tax=Cololabis saira TaxID=129043 RepID=UPI002AD51533|nr:lymphatic vessel endothelial hyaluronic receptor 1b [Cololabis saira]
MATLRCFPSFLLLSFAAFWPSAESSTDKVIHQSHGFHGVFMVIEGERYTLNFTAANATCSFLGVTMATRDQMARAVLHGLETCKFGWIAEQLIAIPRQTSDIRCGRGKTGVVTWRVTVERTFAAYCFNASAIADLDEPLMSSTASTWLTAPTRTQTPAPSSSPSASPSASPLAPRLQTPGSTWIVSSPVTSFERLPASASPRQFITSGPTVVPPAPSTSHQASDPPASSESKTRSPPEHFLAGVVAVSLIAALVLVLAAAGVAWRYGRKRGGFCRCEREQGDDTETEMWKQTSSEMDLWGEHGPGPDLHDGELDRKYSSDVTLCVNPLMRAIGSE